MCSYMMFCHCVRLWVIIRSGRISNLEEIYAEHFANGGLVVVESPLIRSINSRPISQPKMDPEMENTVELVPQDITRYSMRKEEEEGKVGVFMSNF